MVRGSPRMCMATQPTPAAAATGHKRGGDVVDERRPGADRGLGHRRLAGVDRDRQWAASASMTGTTRCRSSASSTASAPGRVDSPPTSITSAPAAIISSPWATAAGRIEPASAVGERVGRHVEDTHHQGHGQRLPGRPRPERPVEEHFSRFGQQVWWRQEGRHRR